MENRNEINQLPVYKKLSQKLYDLFFVDEHKYGRQLDNGTYRLVKAKVSPVTIDDMLLHGKSLLTYQESHTLQTAFIKWVCLDFDLDRKKPKTLEEKSELEKQLPTLEEIKRVKKAAEDASTYLKINNIPHLQEFSGRRGFHIWVIFDEAITKEQGFQFAKLVTNGIKKDETINIDLFPKTGYISKNSKGIGAGVKLPLSIHKISGHLSYFLKDGDFDFGNYQKGLISEKFMTDQLEILDNLELVSLKRIKPLLDEFNELQIKLPGQSYLTKRLFTVGTDQAKLDVILDSLKKCEHLKGTIENYRKELNLKERSMFVGLLAQLTTSDNPNFGYELLMEFFSRVSGFRKDLTEQKLRLAKYYYPVSCDTLGRCKSCACGTIQSPIALHNDLEIIPKPRFAIENISENIFSTILEAEIKYCRTNDEIPLYNHIEKLKGIGLEEVRGLIEDIFSGKLPKVTETFEFERNEGDKIRKLYTVEPLHAVVSTYFLYLLNNMFYTEISANSYGYRVAPGFYNGNIFSNWFVNWGAFSKNIQRILESEEYENYYLIKIDIKNFYDRIDLQALKVKLYEEALPSLDLKIKMLNGQQRSNYLNMVKFLIYLSTKTVGAEIGLPQGPAYARYLAEVYLLGMDKLIEEEIIKDKRREYYYRFVDDIFIFVESEAKAQLVLDRVENWAISNALELNSNKTEIISVSEYNKSGKFKRFQEDAKYAINQANKNKELLTEDERQDVIAKVDQLTDDSKFGLKDNLRFFYYQFSGDNRLDHVRNKINQILPFSDNGRGTLYMIFYSDLFKYQPDVFWNLAYEHERLSGLSLGHYLNTILLNFEELEGKRKLIFYLVSNLSKRTNLNYADKSLMLTLMMKLNMKVTGDLLQSCPEKLIFSVMQTPNLEYNDSNYDLLTKMLEDKQNIDFVELLYEVIHQHPMTLAVATKLARYALQRFNDWMTRDDIKAQVANTITALKYYHCICFLTLFDKNENATPLENSWKILLKISEKIDLQDQKITFGWINNAIKIFAGNLSGGAFSLILANTTGSQLNLSNCKNNFIPLFRDILLIFYFAKGKMKAEMIEKKDQIVDKGTLFAQWLFDPKTRLYPSGSKNLCVRNLALHGLIILENDDQLFVKNINGHLQHEHYTYLETSGKVDDSEIVVEKAGSKTIAILDKAANLIDLIKKLGNQIDMDKSFVDTFDTGLPVYYQAPFEKGGNPLIPFYSAFEHRISNLGIIQPNDLKSYWENLQFIALQRNENVQLLKDSSHPFNFTFKQFAERFIPKSEVLIQTDQDRINFIVSFAKEIEGRNLESIYEFQYVWSKIVWDTISAKSKTSLKDFLEFLHVHFGTYDKGKMAAIDILFSVDARSQIDEQDLHLFFQSIRNSWLGFQSNIQVDDFNLVEILDQEIRGYEQAMPDSVSISDFKRNKLHVRSTYNAISGKDESAIFLDKDDLTGYDVMVYDRNSFTFYAKTYTELHTQLGAKTLYVHKGEKMLYVVPLEYELANAFNRLADRQRVYREAVKTQDKLIHVFPSTDEYVRTEKTYDEYRPIEIEKILKNHYDNVTKTRDRIIGWLNLFNASSLEGSKTLEYLKTSGFDIPDLHRSILDVLSNHIPVSDEDLKFFRDQIKKEQDEGSLIFAVKDPRSDENGLSRLLEVTGFKPRGIDFDSSHNDMVSGSLQGRIIVLTTDITITGTQTEQGLNYYARLPENEQEHDQIRSFLHESNQRYFKFANILEFEQCFKNFREAKEIKFITPISTETFRDKIKGHTLLHGKEPLIISNRIISGVEYNLSAAQVDNNNRKIFYELISDIRLIESIFVPRKGYAKSVTNPGDLNVVLRVSSLPKQHIQLFSLMSKNGGQSLLDFVPNWKGRNKKRD